MKMTPAIFKKPEGITFTPTGDLIVSNEIGDKGKADILFYNYQH